MKPSAHSKLAQVSTQQLSWVTLVESKFYKAKLAGQMKSAQIGKATQQLS